MNRLITPRGTLSILPESSPEQIAGLLSDKGLGFFWHNRPDLQQQALVRIAGQPHATVALAQTDEGILVGYVVIALADPDTRWGRDRIPGLYELGGIEVAREWRGHGVGTAILASIFQRDSYSREIVIGTGYRWCWDLDSTGLTVREYRNLLNRMFGVFGFQLYETDEPNIAWYPDNALLVRIGAEVSSHLLSKFRALLFENRAK